MISITPIKWHWMQSMYKNKNKGGLQDTLVAGNFVKVWECRVHCFSNIQYIFISVVGIHLIVITDQIYVLPIVPNIIQQCLPSQHKIINPKYEKN